MKSQLNAGTPPSFTAAGSNEVEMKDQTEAGNTGEHQGVLTLCRGFRKVIIHNP